MKILNFILAIAITFGVAVQAFAAAAPNCTKQQQAATRAYQALRRAENAVLSLERQISVTTNQYENRMNNLQYRSDMYAAQQRQLGDTATGGVISGVVRFLFGNTKNAGNFLANNINQQTRIRALRNRLGRMQEGIANQMKAADRQYGLKLVRLGRALDRAEAAAVLAAANYEKKQALYDACLG